MMQSLYPFRWPLIFLVIGTILRVVAINMKIMHWPGADTLMIIDTAILIIAGIWLVVKMVLHRQNK